jgi:hypothetical protein
MNEVRRDDRRFGPRSVHGHSGFGFTPRRLQVVPTAFRRALDTGRRCSPYGGTGGRGAHGWLADGDHPGPANVDFASLTMFLRFRVSYRAPPQALASNSNNCPSSSTLCRAGCGPAVGESHGKSKIKVFDASKAKIGEMESEGDANFPIGRMGTWEFGGICPEEYIWRGQVPGQRSC